MRQTMFIPNQYANYKVTWAREEKIKQLEKEGFSQVGVRFHELTLLVLIKKPIKKPKPKEVVEEIVKVIKVKKAVKKNKVNKK